MLSGFSRVQAVDRESAKMARRDFIFLEGA
jgi:hypothetical protein